MRYSSLVLCAALIVSGQSQADESSVTFDASSKTDSVYLKFQNGSLSPSTLENGWHIGAKRTAFQTNSGASGSGNVGIYASEQTDFAAVTECVTTGLNYDEEIPATLSPPAPASSGSSVLNDWYNYDILTHTVKSKGIVYVLTDGSACFKFQILSYSSGKYEARVAPLALGAPEEPKEAVAIEQVINASSPTATSYLTLVDGKLIASDATADWLIAVKRVQFQSNSGASGKGGVAVANSGSKDFASVLSCEGFTFVEDSLLPASGAPGSQPYPGNEVLNAWYDYDFATHTVTSKQDVYAIKNGESCLKLQILSYEAGLFTVQYSVLN